MNNTIDTLPYDITPKELIDTEMYDKNMINTVLEMANFYATKNQYLEDLSHTTHQHL